MKYLILAILLTGCGTADTTYRSRVKEQDFGVSGEYDKATGNSRVDATTKIYFRDPSK